MSVEKKNRRGFVKATIFFKASANRFSLTSKSFSWFNKVGHSQPSIKWASWKGNDMLLKVG